DDETPTSHFDKHTIDLSTPSRPRGRRRTPPQVETDATDETTDEASSDDDSTEAQERRSRSRRGRSRRSSGRSGDSSSDDTSSDDSGDDADDTPEASGDSGRSRRGRGRGRGNQNGGGDDRRSRGGRGSSDGSDSQDSGDASKSEIDDSNGSRSRGGRSRSGSRSDGGRSGNGRSGGGRSGNGRSKSNGSGGNGSSNRGSGSNAKVPTKPEELLKRGSRVLVKITKEPISSKGSRVSTDISLAGRFLVLVPAADYVAVSKKIESSKERRRLRALATSLKPENCGVIVRTVAGGKDAKALDRDLRLLAEKWRKIESKLEGSPQPPVLLHEDVDMVSSIVRDLFTADYDRILIDDPKLHRKLQNYVRAVAPDMAERVVLHRSNAPIYSHVGIEKQVEEAFSERVNMKGGGYLIIEHTEAMHVVDVNSGRAGRGKRRAEENLLAVDMEAAKEIARQLRLRDLGGIICVDFIDLRHERDRRKVTEVLRQEFKKDRAVTKVIGMSDFGVAQITRQRLRPSITAQDEDAPQDAMEAAGATAIPQPERDHSAPEASGGGRDGGRGGRGGRSDSGRGDSGRGRGRRQGSGGRSRREPSESLSPAELSTRVRDWLALYRDSVDARYAKRPILVRVHPLLGSYMRRGFPSPLTRLRFRLRSIPFRVVEDQNVDPLSFEVNDEKSGRSLLSKYPLEG
ncbi:MAG: Rne/Rng family ribonuclease, partial [Bacteroidota bacterium]